MNEESALKKGTGRIQAIANEAFGFTSTKAMRPAFLAISAIAVAMEERLTPGQLDAANALLREADEHMTLQADAEVEYMAFNELGDGEQQHNVKRARTLSAKISTYLKDGA